MPYFEGDFWPNVLEESIKELEQEEEERKREENTSNESTDVRALHFPFQPLPILMYNLEVSLSFQHGLKALSSSSWARNIGVDKLLWF